MRRPLPQVACGLAAGVIFAANAGMAATIIILIACLFVSIRQLRARRWLLTCSAACLGSLWLIWATPVWPGAFGIADTTALVQQVNVGPKATCLTVSLRTLSGWRLPVWNRVCAQVLVGEESEFALGDLISGEFNWQAVAQPLNPGEFDYATYQRRQGILATAFVDDGRTLQRAPARASLRRNVRSLLLDRAKHLAGASGELLATLTLGSSAGDWAEPWRKAGLAHVLAVSGLHVGLLLGMLLAMLRRLPLAPRWRYSLAATALLAYASLLGPLPSVWRSIIMALIGLLALATGRIRDWQSALSAATILLLVYNPWFLYSAGFQLSFAATWGVLAIAPLLLAWMPKLPWRLERIIATSLAAQAATLPFVLHHFYLFTPLALLSNLLVLPFLPVLLALGVIYLLFAPLLGWLAPLVGSAFALVQKLVEWLARVPAMSVSLGQPPFWLVVLTVSLLLAVWLVEEVPLRQWLACAWLMMMLLALGWQPIWRFVGNHYQFRVLAVGQGLCSVLHLPGSRALLFDVGGVDAGVGERIIVPYLRHQGTFAISGIYLSHLDADHVCGLPAVLAAFPVESIYLSPATVTQPGYQQLEQMAIEFGARIRQLNAGDQLVEQALRIQALHPTLASCSGTSEANESSLVLELLWPNLRVLLPGDISMGTEALVLPRALTPVDVLVVAHHGSAGSSGETWLSALSPRTSIISTGRNRYGHPAQQALARLDRYSQRVMRTDQCGAILIWTDLRHTNLSSYRNLDGR